MRLHWVAAGLSMAIACGGRVDSETDATSAAASDGGESTASSQAGRNTTLGGRTSLGGATGGGGKTTTTGGVTGGGGGKTMTTGGVTGGGGKTMTTGGVTGGGSTIPGGGVIGVGGSPDTGGAAGVTAAIATNAGVAGIGATSPTCNDGMQNQDETDRDCGGTRCPACSADRVCRTGFDCRSLNCLGGICRPPSCGSELDCGGLAIPGGTFPMGRSLDGRDAASCSVCGSRELPEHPTTVSDFSLDRHEVTVGQFRRFVDAFETWHAAGHPAADEGAHPLIVGSGWQPAWNGELPIDRSALLRSIRENARLSNWTDAPISSETAPMNGLDWYVAFAFCVWDDGRLPTEAEWEYAAAGGDENRLYPWGFESPTNIHAVHANNSTSPDVPVGSMPLGNGRWGHEDLAGSLWEWVLDELATYPATCTNCATVPTSRDRLLRGGCYANPALGGNLRAAVRFEYNGAYAGDSRGVRCAR